MNYDRIVERTLGRGVVRHVVTRRGTTYTHHECDRRARSAFHSMAQWVARTIQTRTAWDDPDMRASDIRDMRGLLDDVASYVEHVQRELDKAEGVDRASERVRALRNVAGRSSQEAALFLAKADEIERRAT